MKLTKKLLGYVNRVFDKDPLPYVALRVTYAGGLTWQVTEGQLILTVTGGPGASVAYDLAAYTIESLVAAIASRTGFEVTFIDASRQKLSARVLMDGAGDIATSNGDALLGYTSILWAFFEAWAVEIQRLRDQMGQLARQMSTTTAEGVWLDELGSYYGVPRLDGELDAFYGPRIITERLRPLSNNVAIENAIEYYTGQPCQVEDVTVYLGVFPVYDGEIDHDGTYDYDTVGLPNYGLFDVQVAYDLILGGEIDTFLATVQGIVERIRAAGTHMRALNLSDIGSPMSDSFTAPTEAYSSWTAALTAMADSLTEPTESTSAWAAVNTPLSDTLDAPTEAYTAWVATLSAMADTFTAPTESPIMLAGANAALADTLDAPTEAASTWAGALTAMSDSFTAPTDAADGTIRYSLTTTGGAVITDDAGNPIEVGSDPLFI